MQARSDRLLPDVHPRHCSISPTTSSRRASCRRRRCVRRDGDDPYLVVAADKGTATFSDIANAISAEYGFWLGDAFASGGSAGYDHKKMGITARGAWECVKRHFREMGIDTQKHGLHGRRHRRHVRRCVRQRHAAVAAHPAAGRLRSPPHLPRPGPDTARQLRRARAAVRAAALELGRLRPQAASRAAAASSRAAPSRSPLSARGAARCSVSTARAPRPTTSSAPSCACRSTCCGTAASAPTSRRATSATPRSATAPTMRCASTAASCAAKVVGEGGNLGLTQRGRIEYALARRPPQHRLHRQLRRRQHLRRRGQHQDPAEPAGAPRASSPRGERNRLLVRMTDEVAALVLRNNYLQGQAISTLELQAAARLPEFQHLIRSLERSGDLNRALEFLPTDEELAERRKSGVGLTRPELAILLAYSKIWLNNAPARLRRARGPVPVGGARALLPRAGARALPARHQPPPPAPRDHRHRDHQQPGQPHGPDLRAARPGGHRRRAGADRARLHRGARDLRHARGVGADRSARQPGPGEAAVRGRCSRPAACCGTRPTGCSPRAAADCRSMRRCAEFRAGVRQLRSRDRQAADRGGARALRGEPQALTPTAGCRRRWRRASPASRRSTPRSTSWRSRPRTA